MYQHDNTDRMLTAIFVGAGVILMPLGWWLFRKFRDDNKPGFKDFGVGPRGLFAYGGICLMVVGAVSCAVGLLLPSILR